MTYIKTPPAGLSYGSVVPLPFPPVSPDYSFQRRISINKTPEKNSTKTKFKIRRAGTNGSMVVLLLDESSSMGRRLKETVAGINILLEKHREGDIKTLFSMHTFAGSGVKIVHDFVDVKEIANVGAMGSTDLNDAIGDTIRHISAKLKEYKKADRPSVELIIITDGEENCSRFFKHEHVKELISTAEAKNWATTFIGADYDASQAGSSYGFSASRTMSFNDENSELAYRNIATSSAMTKTMLNAGETLASVYKSTEAVLKDNVDGKA